MPRSTGSEESDHSSPRSSHETTVPQDEAKSTRRTPPSGGSKGKTARKPATAGHDCTICRKSNMTLSGLKIHLLTHSGQKPFACTDCDKRFTCSSNLKKHQRIHSKEYIYKCDVCGKTCSDPSNMKKHMTVHSNNKAYTCPSCGKSYSYAQSLRQHMDDVHVGSGNGEKRRKAKRKGHFPCPECGKVFAYYWRCSLHQARVHAVDKPFKCPECGKAFARETILNKHIQTHDKPFPCSECDRRFSFRDQLRKHQRTHTGEKPYTCEQCLRSFTQRGSLTEHMRTHTGQKPFSCKNCGQKFSSSSSLKRHQRRINSCISLDPEEEYPVDSKPKRVIYIGQEPLDVESLRRPSSTQSVEENELPPHFTTMLPTMVNSTSNNGRDELPTMANSSACISEPPTMADSARDDTAMEPNLCAFQSIQSSYTIGSHYHRTSPSETVTMVNSNHHHHIYTRVPATGLVRMVSPNGQRSYVVTSIPPSSSVRSYQPFHQPYTTSQPHISTEVREHVSPIMIAAGASTSTVDVKPTILPDGSIAPPKLSSVITTTKPDLDMTTEHNQLSVTMANNKTMPHSMCRQPLIATTFPNHHSNSLPEVSEPHAQEPLPATTPSQKDTVVHIPVRYHSVIVNGDTERPLHKDSVIENGKNSLKEPVYLIPILNN